MTNEVKKLKEMHKKRRERKAKVRKTIVASISTMAITVCMIVVGFKVNATTVKEELSRHSKENDVVIEKCLNTIQELRASGFDEVTIKKIILDRYENAGSLIYENEEYYIEHK